MSHSQDMKFNKTTDTQTNGILLQSTLIISTLLISNNHLSRSKTLVPVFNMKI